jgi:hypothetical protein
MIHIQDSRAWVAGELYEESENVLLAGIQHLRATGQRSEDRTARDKHAPHAARRAELLPTVLTRVLLTIRYEHPFWTLAMLYWDQGDWIEFLNFAKEGLDYLSREWCAPADDAQGGESDSDAPHSPCTVPDFEIDIVEKIYEASMQLAMHGAGHKRFDEAAAHLDWAEHIAQTYTSAKLDADVPAYHRWCLECAQAEARTGGAKQESPCGGAVEGCRKLWTDTNGRYLRMMAVRVMGCEWRVRDGDVADFQRMCASPKMQALLNHTIEFYFECDDGRVCGAGAQPPLHMFGTPMSLQDVLVMGKVQPLQLLDKMLSQDLPTPEWAYPSWDRRVDSVLRIGYVSSDLLRNHPVGNMMRHVLPLHDLSRMEVTLFIIHEQQRYQVGPVENPKPETRNPKPKTRNPKPET